MTELPNEPPSDPREALSAILKMIGEDPDKVVGDLTMLAKLAHLRLELEGKIPGSVLDAVDKLIAGLSDIE